MAELNNEILISEGEDIPKVEADSSVNVLGFNRKWSEESTFRLLEECRSRLSRFKNPFEKKIDIWREISATMLSYGYRCASEECSLKWRSLKSQYKMRKGSAKGSLWKYYSIMEDTLSLNESIPVNGMNGEDATGLPHLPAMTYTSNTDGLENNSEEPVANETILCSPDFYGITSFEKGNMEEFMVLEGEQDTSDRYTRKWSSDSTLQLLEEYRFRIRQFTNPKQKKIDVWKELSNAMMSHGFHCTAEECDLKWRNLKSQFKTKRGSDKGPLWKYYSIMEEICSWDSSVTDLDSSSLVCIEADANTSASAHSNATDNIIYFPDFCGNYKHENQTAAEEPIGSEEESCKRWSFEATSAFLEECQAHILTLKDPDFAVKRVIWDKISGIISQKGYQFTSRECSHKWRNLKSQYKSRKVFNDVTGKAPSCWKYYHIMERLIETDNNTSIDPIIINVQGSLAPGVSELLDQEIHNSYNVETNQKKKQQSRQEKTNQEIEIFATTSSRTSRSETRKLKEKSNEEIEIFETTASRTSRSDSCKLKGKKDTGHKGHIPPNVIPPRVPSPEIELSAATSHGTSRSELEKPIEHKLSPKISTRPFRFSKGYKALRKQPQDLYSPLWAKRLLERIDRNQTKLLDEVRQARHDSLQMQNERNDLLRNILSELQKKS